jgi:hypothetical protein
VQPHLEECGILSVVLIREVVPGFGLGVAYSHNVEEFPYEPIVGEQQDGIRVFIISRVW